MDRIPSASWLLFTIAIAALGCDAGCLRQPPATAKQDAGGDASSGQPPDDLSQLLRPIRDRSGLPALAAAVSDADRLLALGAVGVRRRGDDTPVETTDLFHLGSCTKAMTATVCARLVDAGQLSWQRTLAEIFPEQATSMHMEYRGVTIEQLLQHRGGTCAALATSHSDLWSALWTPGDVEAQRSAFAQALLARPPEVTPGTEYRYSNAGYMVVGAALERLTGTSGESLMQVQLFTPLAMGSCGFGAPGSAGQVDQPWGHRPGASGPEPVEPGPAADNPPALGPAGTVHCSLEDWARFARAHLEITPGDDAYLSAGSLARMHTPPAGGDYALGWLASPQPWAGGVALTHSGSNNLNFATVWVAPQTSRVMLVATNLGGEEARLAASEVVVALIEQVLR